MNTRERVCVGLSGGVDSSVAALRLQRAGFDVVGVFIKVWQPDFLTCNWEAERLDAMRVAAHLGIPFLTCDAEDAYKRAVADYMIEEYRAGRTPNPDVLCNEHVKFGVFLDYARQCGASKIATGHYARRADDGIPHLYRGKDVTKDQSYFLWRLRTEQLTHALFPVGDTVKTDVRKEAASAGLPTHDKSDSQGVCFLGQISMKEFLAHYITTEPGNVLNEEGEIIGHHDGALFYTIGERHGFTVQHTGGRNIPQYVTGKDMEQNTITVAPQPKAIRSESVRLTDLNSIGSGLKNATTAQFRYRQKPFAVSIDHNDPQCAMLTVLESNIEFPSRGQSCVLYNGDECLGGGIVS